MGKTARYLQFRARGSGDTIKPKLFNVISQLAHFGSCFVVVSIFTVLSRKLLGTALHGVVLGLGGCLVYAVWHVFSWSPPQAPTPGSAWTDFSFMMLGGLLGWMTYGFLTL